MKKKKKKKRKNFISKFVNPLRVIQVRLISFFTPMHFVIQTLRIFREDFFSSFRLISVLGEEAIGSMSSAQHQTERECDAQRNFGCLFELLLTVYYTLAGAVAIPGQQLAWTPFTNPARLGRSQLEAVFLANYDRHRPNFSEGETKIQVWTVINREYKVTIDFTLHIES